MDESRLELKVGAFALVAVALVAGLVLALGRFSAGERFRFFADFSYAGGLPAGAVVKIAGVKVGRIREVEFRPDAREDGRAIPVRLHVDIDKEAARALRDDAVATVGQQGALGESYLEVLPGRSPRALEANAVVRGLDPPRLDLVLARFYNLIESATEDDAFRSFLVEVSQLARGAREMLSQHDGEVVSALEGVTGMIADGRHIVTDARVAVRGAAQLLGDPELKQAIADVAEVAKLAKHELPVIAKDARTLLQRMDELTEKLGPEDGERLKATLAKVESISQSAEVVLGRIERGEGTLGHLAKDPEVYQDLRALLQDIKDHPWKLVWKK